MDISKILDFHHMVMVAAGQQPHEDETSCGPLCQHPACWDSKRRRERGVPRLRKEESDEEDGEIDLPTMKVYNMLDEYGESNKDRYPARYGGRPIHDRSSSMRKISQPLRSASFGMTTAPFATPVSYEKGSRGSAQTNMRVVEVQEVFDKADLNSRWDETFVTRKYLVWVPNANRLSMKKQQLAITDGSEDAKKSEPKTLLPRDLTETMVPLQIMQQREETVMFDEWPVLKKRQHRTRSPVFRHGTYPKTPYNGAKPDVDSEGCVICEIRERIQSSVRELLSLPRDVLVQVLDRTKESDFVSREKIHGIIQDVLNTARDGRSAQPARDFSPPRQGHLQTDDVLVQQKAPLHLNKQRNVRDTHSLVQRPVFMMDQDDDNNSSVDTARDVADASSTQGTLLKAAGFSRYSKPLPAISTDSLKTPVETPRSRISGYKERKKIPSISLGLPELPSGLRQTRAFVYSSRHRPDFSLVPVPTPPQSERSSEGPGSEHGTTLHVNLPSMVEIPEPEFYSESGGVKSADGRATEEGTLMHLMSPALSTNVPKAPAGTPATFHSPTKSLMFRDLTATSLEGRGMPPSREISMSPGHKFWVPGAVSPGLTATTDEGLQTIQETTREQVPGAGSLNSSHRQSHNVQSSDPATERHTAPGPTADGAAAQAGSPEDWPQVTEPSFDTVAGIMGSRSETNFMTEASMAGDHAAAAQRGRCDLGSRGSERSTLARRILDEAAKVESPAPPPPSPEPKENGDKSAARGKRDSKSRESATMEPLIEQTESEGSNSPEKRAQGMKDRSTNRDKASYPGQGMEPAIQEEANQSPRPTALNLDHSAAGDSLDPVSKVMVSHVAPRPTGSREKLQQTFVNVDIPAEDMSSVRAEQGSTPPDFTPSVTTTSPGKNSPSKLSTPKSSAGPSSPLRKSPAASPGFRDKKVKVRRSSGGKGKKNDEGAARGGGADPGSADK